MTETEHADNADTSPERRARVRHHFTAQHYFAAGLFAKRAGLYESAPPASSADIVIQDHRSYVVGAVISSVAMLESNINDLFVEAAEQRPAAFPKLPEHFQPLMAAMWDEIEKASVLKKYQIALACAGKEPFGKGADDYQQADNVILLRNRLVHFKPEWPDEAKEDRRIETRLSGRFADNKYSSPNQPFFPDRCLGAGCAEWAVRASISFIQAFRKRSGLEGGLRISSVRVS